MNSAAIKAGKEGKTALSMEVKQHDIISCFILFIYFQSSYSFICLCIYLFIHLFVYVFTYLIIYLFIHLFISLICLFI